MDGLGGANHDKRGKAVVASQKSGGSNVNVAAAASPKRSSKETAEQGKLYLENPLTLLAVEPIQFVDPVTNRLKREVKQRLRKLLDATLSDIAESSRLEAKGPSTVYVGVAGIAFAHLRVAEFASNRLHRQFHGAFDNKRDATRYLAAASLYLDSAWPAAPGAQSRAGRWEQLQALVADSAYWGGTRCSLQCGPAGIALVQAYLAFQEDNPSAFDRAIELYLRVYSNHIAPAAAADPRGCGDCDTIRDIESEWLYGRAGYLMGCLMLNNLVKQLGYPVPSSSTGGGAAVPGNRSSSRSNGATAYPPIPDTVISELTNTLLLIGKHFADISGALYRGIPLMYCWHGKFYLGAAHGLIGVLHVLLHTPAVDAHRDTRELIKTAIDTLVWMRIPKGNWPVAYDSCKANAYQFCHGATGAMFLFVRACQVFPESAEDYQAIVNEIGDLLWRFGMLRKGVGLCHGISGSAYAFLAAYRCTGNPRWLERAVNFTFAMNEPGVRAHLRTPDHPHSLFEGTAGVVCLISDILRSPGAAAFPFFELERWE